MNVFETAGLRMNGSFRGGSLHAILERAIHARNRESGYIVAAPRLLRGIAQKLNRGAWRHQVSSRQSRAVRENHVSVRNPGAREEILLHFQSSPAGPDSGPFPRNGTQQ